MAPKCIWRICDCRALNIKLSNKITFIFKKYYITSTLITFKIIIKKYNNGKQHLGTFWTCQIGNVMSYTCELELNSIKCNLSAAYIMQLYLNFQFTAILRSNANHTVTNVTRKHCTEGQNIWNAYVIVYIRTWSQISPIRRVHLKETICTIRLQHIRIFSNI